MPIPNEILAVERPKNTRVKAGPKGTYYVIARTCIYKNGRNVPKELGVVGRILDGKYVPNPVKKDENIDIKKYGTVALFHKAGSSIYEDLLQLKWSGNVMSNGIFRPFFFKNILNILSFGGECGIIYIVVATIHNRRNILCQFQMRF